MTNSMILYNEKKFKNWNLPFNQLKFIFNSTFCSGMFNFAYIYVSVSDVSGTTLTHSSNKKQTRNIF